MSSSSRTATDALVARQPVYDPTLKVVAYELLVQGGDAADTDASSTISEIGLNLVVGHPACIPVTRGTLLEGFATALPADRVVLAVSSDLQLDRAALDAIRELVADGYRLALMDYERDGPLEPLLPLAHVVGLNVAGLDRGVLRAELAHLRSRGVRRLARGVEQHDELELCIALGFDLLQGYLICQPRVVSEQGLKVISVNRVRLLARLQDDDIDFNELQEIIGRDVALSYNLLRFINSAFFALPRRVESIRDALVLLGAINVRKWATLMALADRSMVELLSGLPLSREIIAALLNYDGAKGRILRAAVAYERGNFGELGEVPPTRTPLSDLYAQAVEWATDASGALPG